MPDDRASISGHSGASPASHRRTAATRVRSIARRSAIRFRTRGEERPVRKTQLGLAREQLRAAGGREQVDVPPSHPLRRLRPGAEPRFIGGGRRVDPVRAVQQRVGEHHGTGHGHGRALPGERGSRVPRATERRALLRGPVRHRRLGHLVPVRSRISSTLWPWATRGRVLAAAAPLTEPTVAGSAPRNGSRREAAAFPWLSGRCGRPRRWSGCTPAGCRAAARRPRPPVRR